MDKAQSLLSLARLCEKPNPSGNINCAIFATLYPEKFSDEASAAQYARPNWTRNGADWLWLRDVGMLRYTESVDAAMTLVPEGWSIGVGDLRGYDPPVWRAHLRDHRPQSLTPEGHSHIWVEGNTPESMALAICTAALRALAAEKTNG
ncbi:hypothetical protein [Novosphingobium sp.]|uniref:hypothetical protein n=1 Tax=Novosphingobium sp. TaxID=1874826 RepID=UPI003D6D008F